MPPPSAHASVNPPLQKTDPRGRPASCNQDHTHLDLAAAPPDPAFPDLRILQDRGTLFVRFIDHLDRHFDRDIARMDRKGNRIRGVGTSITQTMAWSSMDGWTIVDTMVAQWNTTAAFFVSHGQWQARRL